MNYHDIHIFGRPLGTLVIVFYKVLWGIAESIAGLLLIFSKSLIAGELIEDPQDLFVNWLLRSVHFNPTTAVHAGGLLLFLAAIKFLLAAGVWFDSWRMRRYLIIFLCLISAYALYDLFTHFGILKLFTLGSDLAILIYLYEFLPYHLGHASIKKVV